MNIVKTFKWRLLLKSRYIKHLWFLQSDVKLPREFVPKCRKEFNVSYFIPVEIKRVNSTSFFLSTGFKTNCVN